MKLDLETRNQIRDLLIPRVGSPQERQQLVNNAFYGSRLITRLDIYSGSPVIFPAT